jgi:hypothetical protein
MSLQRQQPARVFAFIFSGTASANPIMASAFGPQFLNCQFTIANQLPPVGTYDVVFFLRAARTGLFDIVRVKWCVSP